MSSAFLESKNLPKGLEIDLFLYIGIIYYIIDGNYLEKYIDFTNELIKKT
jgi:hypothetical protein